MKRKNEKGVRGYEKKKNFEASAIGSRFSDMDFERFANMSLVVNWPLNNISMILLGCL